MDLAEATAALEKAGSEPGRKALGRQGGRGPAYGVADADLERIARRAGRDAALAEALWRTGNRDARALATMVDDAGALPMSRLEARAREIDRTLAAPLATRLASASPHATTLAERWTRDAGECVAEAGWHLVAALAMRASSPVADAWFLARIADVEGGIRGARPFVRAAMNVALVATGSRSDALEAAAIDAARRIGPVEVDRGEAVGRTLDARTAIPRARARAREREDRFGMRRDAARPPGP